MSTYKSLSPYKAGQRLSRGKFKSLAVGKKAYSILTCDGDAYLAQIYLTIEGLKATETVQVRFITASYKKGTTTKTAGVYPTQEQHGSSGGTYISHTQIGKTGKGAGGRSNRLRVQVWTDSKTAKVTSVQAKYLKG